MGTFEFDFDYSNIEDLRSTFSNSYEFWMDMAFCLNYGNRTSFYKLRVKDRMKFLKQNEPIILKLSESYLTDEQETALENELTENFKRFLYGRSFNELLK